MHIETIILIATWFGISVMLFISTFIFFIAIMKMREIQDELFRLHWSVRWICFLILFIGLILDVALNWILLTIAFAELPREFLSTSRVIRHKYESTHWRQDLALWFCKNWLTPFDERHCEK
jgi:hypothetical protein